MNSFIKREYDYAIRICAYLAGHERLRPIPLPEVARKLHLPKPFTTKIVHRLMKSGITASVQGKSGGIFLQKNPKELSLLAILKAMHFNATLNECTSDHSNCPIIKICQIHLFFRETEGKLMEIFQNKMISELVIKDSDL